MIYQVSRLHFTTVCQKVAGDGSGGVTLWCFVRVIFWWAWNIFLWLATYYREILLTLSVSIPLLVYMDFLLNRGHFRTTAKIYANAPFITPRKYG